jgi:hypothetical protein
VKCQETKTLAPQTPAWNTERRTLQPQNSRANFMVTKPHKKLHTGRIKGYATKKAPIYSIAPPKARQEAANSTRIYSGYQQELEAIWHKKLLDKISEALMQ